MVEKKLIVLTGLLIIVGIGVGYFAAKWQSLKVERQALPTPTPAFPVYQTDPEFGFPASFISPIRWTENKTVLVQMKGLLQPQTWKDGQVKISVGDSEYTLLLPEKIKLICQTQTVKRVRNTSPKKGDESLNADFLNTFIDLREVANFTPNIATGKIKAFFSQRPQVSLIAEDTGDHKTFRLKLLVGYGCNLNQ